LGMWDAIVPVLTCQIALNGEIFGINLLKLVQVNNSKCKINEN